MYLRNEEGRLWSPEVMLRYRLKLEPDDNDTILVTSPDLPIATFGEDEADAYRQAGQAITAVLQSMIDAREEVPMPDLANADGAPEYMPSLKTLFKLRLHNIMVAAGLNRADLQGRLGWKPDSVDRLFRLDHQSKLDQIEEAYRALGKEISVDVKDASVAA